MYILHRHPKIISLLVSGLLFAFVFVTPAFADDGPEGSELRAADWMWEVAILFAAMTALMIVWAWRNGEFSNLEEPKYTMLKHDGEEYERLELEEEGY